MDRKSSINGLKSGIVQILGAKRFENIVWIETKYDYSIICQTQNDDISNKKNLEGFVCKKYTNGEVEWRMEIGRFKNKNEWKGGELDNWIGGVLDISKEATTFRQYDENGNKTADNLVYNKLSQTWKKYESEYVHFVEEVDDNST